MKRLRGVYNELRIKLLSQITEQSINTQYKKETCIIIYDIQYMTSLPHRVKTLLHSLNLRLDLFEEFLYCLIAGDGTTGRTFQIALTF